MEWQNVLLGFCVGIGLSAAAGFRVFVPLLFASVCLKFQLFPSITNFVGVENWLGSTPALTCFLVATVVEIVAYKVPFLDNFLDTISGPIALGAGALLTSEFLAPVDNSFLKYTLGIVAGAGSAGMVFGSTALVRLMSSKTTAGIANPFFSLFELAASIVTTLMSFLLPFITVFFGIIFAIAVFIVWKKMKPTAKTNLFPFSSPPKQSEK